MTDDLAIIRKLELEIGLNLVQLNPKTFGLNDHIGYLLNENKRIDGLYLEGCNLAYLPETLAILTNLEILGLNNNKFTKIPEVITKLKNLSILHLKNNQLTTLPESIGELINLTWLDLRKNHLSTLPDSFAKLLNLIELDLFDNKFTTLPETISKLTKLKMLYLGENRLTILPDFIGKLTNLNMLDLSENLFNYLPEVIGKLKNLGQLDLSSNQIKILPEFLLDLDMEIKWEWLGYNIVCVYGNPIELPPIEIIQKGNKAIRDYYRSLKSEYKSLNEVKVLLIGDGGSGKTSLVKQMFGEKYDANEKQTHGILIRDNAYTVNDKTINAHFWDFGGQQIMHHTHQFFLSKRSIYILVLDCRKEQDEEYWLKHIQSFGGDSPILVVINKIDENPGFEINRKFLSEKYPSIQGYFRVSCQNGEGIAEFIKALEKAFTYVEHLNITWSLSWFRVKEVLQKMTEPFINVQRFCEICESQKIPNDSGRETLVEFLHDLGVVVHFKDFALRDVHVLEPKWVTGAVYRIINSQELAEKGGRLHLRLLDKILQKKNHDDYEFPADKHKYIIELMKKFELCYEIDHDVILLPNLLPVPEPEFAFAYDNCLRFIIEYDFLPKSIIPRFIIKMNRDIKDSKLQWRTGVVLADKEFESEAVIKVDERDKKIYIYVAGSQRREYFSIILFNLRDINSSFEKIDAVEKVPMPDQPAITVSYKHLLRLDKAGNQLYIPDGSDKEYSVKELLGYIQEEKSDLNEILKILRKLESQSESRESFIEKANKVLTLQPNVFGIGVNINAIIEKLFPQKSKFIDTIPGVKIIYK